MTVTLNEDEIRQILLDYVNDKFMLQLNACIVNPDFNNTAVVFFEPKEATK